MPCRAPSVALAALGAWLAASAIAYAARTDIIVLANGDRLTGEVVQMRQGKLEVKTDDAGTISIEWDKVASVATADQYELNMRDGSRHLGRLRPGPTAGFVNAAQDSGALVPLAMTDIASFARIKSGFVQRIDGSFDLGASYTKSSGIGELYLDAGARYRRPAYAYEGSVSANLTRQPEAEDTTRSSVQLSYTRYRGARWFASALGFFESNEELGFTFRGTGAGSIGRYLARSEHAEWLVTGGLAAGRETTVEDEIVTNVDALIGTTLSVFHYDYPTTRLDLSVLVFPSLDDGGRVRVNANAKFRREVVKDFFVAVTGYEAFDNRPRTTGATRNDFGGSLSFGWSF
jgi:hypothetical protein